MRIYLSHESPSGAPQARSASVACEHPRCNSKQKVASNHKPTRIFGGHGVAPSSPRKRHRAAKPTLPRAPGTLRGEMTQIYVPSVHARVPKRPKTRRGRKNDCFGPRIAGFRPHAAQYGATTALCARGTPTRPNRHVCTERGSIKVFRAKKGYPLPSGTTRIFRIFLGF